MCGECRGGWLTPDLNGASAGNKTLGECFALFDVIHRVTTEHATVARLTQQVLASFAADGVVYVELRTTPKARPEHGMTKRSYTEAVLGALRQYQQNHPLGRVQRTPLRRQA